jgi:CheY-like chemotaxis protein
MKVLVIEDFADVADAISAYVSRNVAGGEVLVARNGEEAEALLQTGPFDLIVCDRKLPSAARSLDTAEQHGDRLIRLCAERYPGTPMIVFTAYPAYEMWSSLLRASRRGDPFGEGSPRSLVQVYQKADLQECLKEISRVAEQLAALDSVELDFRSLAGNRLRSSEVRVLKLFARPKQGRMVRVARIGGGLSPTTTLRVEVEDGRGVLRARTFAKLGKLDLLERELRAYNEFLPPMLPGGAYAPFADRVECGAGDVGGLFYSLADASSATLWSRLLTEPEAAASLVRKLSATLDPWRGASTRIETTVREVRRGLLKDDALARRHGEEVLGTGNWNAFESRQVNTRRGPQHGDLHGQNVMVSGGQDVVLIDYGDVRRSQASLDFVVLELSLLFHPENVLRRWSWPSVEQAGMWDNVEVFAEGAEGADYVKACREAAMARAAGPREVYALAYAYALRQFKYEDTNKDLAAAIMQAAVRAFGDT